MGCCSNQRHVLSSDDSNPFNELGDARDYDYNMFTELGAWAKKVHIKPSKISKTVKASAKEEIKIQRTARYIAGPKKPDHDPLVVIRNDKDVDKASDLITALPSTAKGIAKVANRLVGKVELRPNEMLVMVDSGSFVHAVDAQILPCTEEEDKQVAETACGGILKKLSSANVLAEMGGVTTSVKSYHKRIKVPILSVRRLCRDGSRCLIKRRGGHIENLRTGKRFASSSIKVCTLLR